MVKPSCYQPGITASWRLGPFLRPRLIETPVGVSTGKLATDGVPMDLRSSAVVVYGHTKSSLIYYVQGECSAGTARHHGIYAHILLGNGEIVYRGGGLAQTRPDCNGSRKWRRIYYICTQASF